MDEPTSALDSHTERIVGEILSELKGITRIIVTHREGILQYTD
jgi:ABC-type bacteriocin/lantibiotic exporter with double-glycine peptidase domain